MKTKLLYWLLPVLMSLGAGGCMKSDEGKPSEVEQFNPTAILDTLIATRHEQSENSKRVSMLRARVDSAITHFTQVAKKREVAPYYILTSERRSYPLTSTGIIARITEDMQFELVAALSQQKFDAIRIINDNAKGKSVSSVVVPPDQALNYTSNDGLTVVAFSGPLASPLGEFVAENNGSSLSVEYLMNGSLVKTLPIPDTRKQCIASTWQLASSRKLLDSLERRQMFYSRKIEIIHMNLSNKKNLRDELGH